MKANLLINQKEFYLELAKFVREALVGIMSRAYDSFGPNVDRDTLLQIAKFIAEYFNTVALLKFEQKCSDEYLNNTWDRICSTKLGLRYHHIDILILSFNLAIAVFKNMEQVSTDIKIHISKRGEYKKEYMEKVIQNISSTILMFEDTISAEYVGCASIGHEIDTNGEPMFSADFVLESDLGEKK